MHPQKIYYFVHSWQVGSATTVSAAASRPKGSSACDGSRVSRAFETLDCLGCRRVLQ